VGGVAGQLGAPMLYKMDLHAYALEFGGAIRRATDDGAGVINISAGYPCRILISVVSYQICTGPGRAQLLNDLTQAAVAVAISVCTPAGAPFCLGWALEKESNFASLVVD